MNRLEHGNAIRIYVRSRCEPQTALNHCTEVGNNVAKHVWRNHDLIPFGILNEPHAYRIHEIKLGVYILIVSCNVVKNLPPEPVGMR